MSSSQCPLGDFGPAPADVDLCQNKNPSIIGPVVIVMTFGMAAVALRIYCRYTLSRSTPGSFLAIDDYCVLVALSLATAMAVCCFLGVHYGGGTHLWAMTVDRFNNLWKTLLAFVLIYVAGVTLTKTSILLFYRRLFGAGVAWWIVFSLVWGYFISITVTALISCRPLPYFWEQYTNPKAVGTCIDIPHFFLINGICAMLIDVCILMIPLPIIYKLNMPPGKKALVSAIMLLGSFVCIASIVRIVELDRFTKDSDVVWAMAEVFVWSCCEPFIGIVCACLPTYGPLFARVKWFNNISDKAKITPKEGGNALITFGGSHMPSKNTTNKSNGWSRIGKKDDTTTTNSIFRTRPDDDEMELTVNVHGGKQQPHSHVHETTSLEGRSTTRASDSDGMDVPKNMHVHVQKDVSWKVESKDYP